MRINLSGTKPVTSDQRFPSLHLGLAVATKEAPHARIGEIQGLFADPWMLVVRIKADFGSDKIAIAEALVPHQSLPQ